MKILAELIRTAGLVHPIEGFHEGIYRLKYCVRGLLNPSLHQEWFAILRAPQLSELVRTQPRIHGKLQRPYLHRLLGPQARLEALKLHYAFVMTTFPEKMIHAVCSPAGLHLLSLPLKENKNLTIRLLYHGQFEKEGELTLGVFHGSSPHAACFLTFTVSCPTPSRRELFIGGMQGNRAGGEKEDVISITRDMHGLRPKALLIFAIQQLASVWGMTAIRAVSDEMHIYRHLRRRRTINARYNEFWTECGGQLAPDSMFQLPVGHVERDLTGLKPTKRQMYRRRYAMLNQLSQQIHANLSNPLCRHESNQFGRADCVARMELANREGPSTSATPALVSFADGDRIQFAGATELTNISPTGPAVSGRALYISGDNPAGAAWEPGPGGASALNL